MYKLTEKEQSIIFLIKQGLTNVEIAEHIGVKPTTVSTYLYKLFKIYQAKNRIDLYNKIMKGD